MDLAAPLLRSFRTVGAPTAIHSSPCAGGKAPVEGLADGTGRAAARDPAPADAVALLRPEFDETLRFRDLARRLPLSPHERAIEGPAV